MINTYSKNSIISLALIISITLTPLAFIPQKANAESVTGYMGGVSGVITQLPLCMDKVESAMAKIFPKGAIAEKLKSAQFDTEYDAYNSTHDAAGEPLKDGVAAASFNEDSIPITLPDDIANSIKATKTAAESTKKTVQDSNTNDTCLKSIGRVIIKTLLQKLTTSTVEWINNGYDGSPLFVQDPGKFFGDIAKNEIKQFGLEINGSGNPYGKDWMRSNIIAFNQKFADNAKYSLDEVIQQETPGFTAVTFNTDFSQGGWGAWDALTQTPANNPLGFNLMASNELQQRLAGTKQSNAQNVRADLQTAGGYLGSEQCTDPVGLTREQNNAALNQSGKGMKPIPMNYTRISADGVKVYDNPSYIAALTKWTNTPDPITCKKWEYVTPGQVVAAAATNVVGYTGSSLLKADDLNDAVAAILDAMLSNFSNDLMVKGLAKLDESDTFVLGAEGNYVVNTDNTEDYSNFQDFPGYLVAGNSFLQSNPNFDIRTDLTQALIDEQRIFIDKLKEQNKELKEIKQGDQVAVARTGMGTWTSATGLGTWTALDFGGNPITNATNEATGEWDFGPVGLVSTSNAWRSSDSSSDKKMGTFGGFLSGGIWRATTGTGGTGKATWTGRSKEYMAQPQMSGGSKFTGNLGLIPTIFQLDYCIPGPHPGWENDSRNILAATLSTVVPETQYSLTDRSKEDLQKLITSAIKLGATAGAAVLGATIGATALSVIPVVGTIIGAALGAVIGLLVDWIIKKTSTDNYSKLRAYYASMFTAFTALNLNADTKPETTPSASNLYSKQRFVQVMNTFLDRYIEIAHKFYAPEKMPRATVEAATKFLEIKGYNQMYKNNEERIILMKSLVTRLSEIKGKIDTLNKDKNSSSYENDLKPIISEFGRISVDMINGDDIAVVDNRIKQIVDERKYIYDNLLKGPSGCEQDLDNGIGVEGPGLPWQVYDTKRMTYPGEIMYDYNLWNNKDTSPFPDPYNGGYTNYISGHGVENGAVNNIGPGFLSWFAFEDFTQTCAVRMSLPSEGKGGFGDPYCLEVNDLLPMNDGGGAFLGIIQPYYDNSDWRQKNGYFEMTIGVY